MSLRPNFLISTHSIFENVNSFSKLFEDLDI